MKIIIGNIIVILNVIIDNMSLFRFKKCFNYINITITLAILIVIAFLCTNLFQYISIFDIDDINSTYDAYPLWREENGRYVCNMLSRIFCFYPAKLFNIHIQDFANTIGAALYTLIISLCCIMSAFFCRIADKKLSAFNILLIFSLLSFWKYISDSTPNYSMIFSFQYGYALAAFFGLSFLYIIIRNFINFANSSEKITKKHLYIITILSFCAGNSTQIASYSSCAMLGLILLIIILKNKFNINEIKKIILNQHFLFPITAFIAGFLLMILSPGFWHELSWRHAESFDQVINIFTPFIKSLINVVFIWKLPFYKFILWLYILIIIKNLIKKQSIKETFKVILASVLPLAGIWIYFLMLITLGPSFPGTGDIIFWTYEPFYSFYYVLVLCAIISFLSGYLLSNTKFPIKILGIIFLCIMVYNTFDITNIIPRYNEYKNDLFYLRKTMYTCDKISLTYINNNQTIILPEFCKKASTIYSSEYFIKKYFKAAYNKNTDISINWTDDDNAIENFNSLGGCIFEKELEKTYFKTLFINNKKEE